MCECERITGIGVGGLHRGDLLPEAEVPAEVGAQEAQGAEVVEVEAQGGVASPRIRHQIHRVGRHFQFIIYILFQLGNLLNETEATQDRGTGDSVFSSSNSIARTYSYTQLHNIWHLVVLNVYSGRDQAARQNHRRARRLSVAISFLLDQEASPEY